MPLNLVKLPKFSPAPMVTEQTADLIVAATYTLGDIHG